MKEIKENNDRNAEEDELQNIISQSIKGHTNQHFDFKSSMQSKGCFSCMQPSYNISIETYMDKFIFFPDEVVKIKMIVDNRQSQRRIKNINCILRQRVRITKNSQDANQGQFWERTYDLHRI